MGGNLPIFKYNLGWYFFALFSVVTTVLFGRLYCGRVCAYGALTQLLDPIVPARFRYDVPLRIERQASKIKYGILAAVMIYFLATRDMSIYRYVEPFWMFTGHETMAMWIALGVLLVATVVVRKSLLPLPVSARRGAGAALEADDLRHQALVRVQQLQAVRENLPVGRDRRAEDHHDGVRALRRLRAPLHGPAEVPALDHHPPQERHPRPPAARAAAVSRQSRTASRFADSAGRGSYRIERWCSTRRDAAIRACASARPGEAPRRGSASHLARSVSSRRRPAEVPAREPGSTMRETHLSARCHRRSKSGACAPGPRPLTPSDAFPATPCVASLAWFASGTVSRRLDAARAKRARCAR